MTLFDGLAQAVADGLSACLSDEQKARATALILAHTAMPGADVYDRIRMARYIITEREDEPTPPEVVEVRTISGDRTEFVLHDLTRPPEAHPDDPGPEEPSGALPDLGDAEPAPMAGTHWHGHRGAPPT